MGNSSSRSERLLHIAADLAGERLNRGSRDAESAGVGWTEADLVKMRAMSELGIELSITGNIVTELELSKLRIPQKRISIRSK